MFGVVVNFLEKGGLLCMKGSVIIVLLFVLVSALEANYVERYLEGKISLQSILFELTSKSRYNELYEILVRILERTNVYEVRFEKFKLGYSLGKDVLADLYTLMESGEFERYVYSSVFAERRVISTFSEYLVSREYVSETVVKNFSRVCFLNNYLEEVVKVVIGKNVTNENLLFEILVKLENFLMFSHIREIYYALRGKIKFGVESMVIFARGLGECGDEEALSLVYMDHPMVVPLRIELLARFGYFDEVIREVSKYGISSRSAKYVFISFLNLRDFENAKLCLNYITLLGLKNYFSKVIDIFTSKDLVSVERELRRFLVDDTITEDIKNQIAFLLWVIETSTTREDLVNEVIFSLNYFNGVRSKKVYSERIMSRIKTLE